MCNMQAEGDFFGIHDPSSGLASGQMARVAIWPAFNQSGFSRGFHTAVSVYAGNARYWNLHTQLPSACKLSTLLAWLI
jgi:hypothetical protein